MARAKDQSGVSTSSEWLRRNGFGTYGAQESGGTLALRKTRPISRERYDELFESRVCPACSGALSCRSNPNGGKFLGCGDPCEYYCGWREDLDRGEERINPYERDLTEIAVELPK